MAVKIEMDDKSPEVMEAIMKATDRGLMAIGERAVGYAQRKCPVDTGRLRGSITYAVSDWECYIGTNVEYAPYVEMGTGKYAETGGRQTPWAFQDSKGNWHKTEGTKAQPFIRPSASEHTSEYKQILEDSLANL